MNTILLIFLYLPLIHARIFKLDDKNLDIYHKDLVNYIKLKRNESQASSNEVFSVEFDILKLPTNISLSMLFPIYPRIFNYMKCDESMEKRLSVKPQKNELYTRYDQFFRLDLNFTSDLSSIIFNKEYNNSTLINEISGEIYLNKILSISPIFITLFVFSFLGWILLCSCHCYSYCPIICRKEKGEGYSDTMKNISLIFFSFISLNVLVSFILSYYRYK